MMRPVRVWLLAGLTVSAVCLATGAAWAAGLALREGSADWMANASAGNTAKAYDAGTAWTNPAGMALLTESEIDGSVSYIDPYSHFEGLDVGAAQMVSANGNAPRNNIKSALVGGLFGVWSYSPDLKFGLAMTSPYGNSIEYPTGWVGRYQNLVASIVDEEVLLSAAYRINDQLSIGGGPVIDYLHANIAKAINIGPASALVGDPLADMQADNIAVGYDIGSLFQVSDNLRFGLNYRSRITEDLVGNQTVSVPYGLSVVSPITAAVLAQNNTGGRSQITLPDSVNAGAYWQVLPEVALLAEIQWTHWSLFHQLTTTPDNPLASTSNTLENWRNTWFGAIGANWKLMDVLTLQGGLAFDETPISSAQYRTAMIPDNNRYIVGLGLTWEMMQDLDMQIAYSHIFIPTANVASSATPTAGTLVGKNYSHDDSVSMGFRAKF